ncbi:hypothetical protein [Rhodopirellula baltica]
MSDYNPFTTPIEEPEDAVVVSGTGLKIPTAIRISTLIFSVGCSFALSFAAAIMFTAGASAESGYVALFVACVVSPVSNAIIGAACIGICALGGWSRDPTAILATLAAPFLSIGYVVYQAITSIYFYVC